MSHRAKSLTKRIQAAVDSVLNDESLASFQRHGEGDGMSFRRYVRIGPDGECEISVYPDKWWSKSGGKAFVELYCLNRQFQRRMGGCDQSWLQPDYALPLCHFQYRTGSQAVDTALPIESQGDVDRFAEWLREFLLEEGLPWFRQLQNADGIEEYLVCEGSLFAAAKWLVALGRVGDGRRRFTQFLSKLPRQIDAQLAEAEAVGLIGPEEAKSLALASIQQEATYRKRITEWAESRVA